MKFKMITTALAALLALGIAMSASAGSVVDTDGDGVPDGVDNCVTLANGPGGSEPGASCSAQEDADSDGFGNICDPDFDQSNTVGFGDFQLLLGAIGTADAVIDVDCSGAVGFSDFQRLLAFIGLPPG